MFFVHDRALLDSYLRQKIVLLNNTHKCMCLHVRPLAVFAMVHVPRPLLPVRSTVFGDGSVQGSQRRHKEGCSDHCVSAPGVGRWRLAPVGFM